MKKFWLWDLSPRGEQRSLAILFLRLFIGCVMLTHGFVKVANFSFLSTHFLDPIGIGVMPSLVLCIFAEVVCSFLLILGFLTRPAALVLVINMTVATFFVSHGSFSLRELPLMYLVIYIVMVVFGGGRYSVDWVVFTSKSNPQEDYWQNMTDFDRVFRLLLALVLWFFILSGIASGIGAFILLLITVPLFVTSFWGYCGLYKFLGRKQHAKK